jgi:hypothetical protein
MYTPARNVIGSHQNYKHGGLYWYKPEANTSNTFFNKRTKLGDVLVLRQHDWHERPWVPSTPLGPKVLNINM